MRTIYHRLGEHPLAGRVLLVPVFVGACYLYDWHWLRALTTATLVQISAWIGVNMARSGVDLIRVAGVSAKFVVACTMIDAYFGAIPLLWRTNIPWSKNLLKLMAVLGGVFVLNIVRLELGFVALTKGVPWWLAHEVVAGFAYFCLYWYIARERAWASPSTNSKSPARLSPGEATSSWLPVGQELQS